MSESNTQVLQLHTQGDLLSTNARDYLAKWRERLDSVSGINEIELDLEATSMIDSIGLNLLIGLARESSKRGIDFRVIHPSQTSMRLFRFLGILPLLGLAPQKN